ncbi:MAG: UbiA family prenyltransferase [Nitrososphaeria archaeon]|nr:UbiA family prenyltransferase [Nitrososphaeria archaeon]
MKKSSLKHYITIVRPKNSIMIGLAVIIGIILTDPRQILSIKTIYGFLTGFFISSYSMVVNDIYDVEVDIINRMDRPLAKGYITVKNAWAYSIILLFTGLIFAYFTSILGLLIAILFAFISWLYNFDLKKHGIIGNITVAVSTIIPYIYGNVILAYNGLQDFIVNPTLLSPIVCWFSTVSFFAVTGREVIKTISDIEGDKIRGVQSVAIKFGAEKAAKIGSVFFILAIVCTLGPYIFKHMGEIYLLSVMVPDIIFIYLVNSILKNNSRENALRVKRIALNGMLIGFLSFTIESVWVIIVELTLGGKI